MLSADDIAFEIGGETIVLRPSLRAAIRLERKFKGFETFDLARAEGNIGVLGEVIRATATSPVRPDRLFTSPLAPKLEIILEACARVVFACVGIDPDAPKEPPKAKASGKPRTWAETFEDLYGAGTGWLGWSAEQTLDATPTEIRIAMEARIKCLAACYGWKLNEAEADHHTPHGQDDILDRDGLHALW